MEQLQSEQTLVHGNARSVGSVQPTVDTRRARWAVALVFCFDGLLVAMWVARIPAVQQQLALREGILGIALLGPAIGALVSMPLMGWFIAHNGSRMATRVSALALCVALPPLALAPNWVVLMLALVVFGACFGALDVAMNAQAAAVEQRYARPIMASFHGLFSLGALGGAAVGGVMAARGVPLLFHFVAAALVIGVAAQITAYWLLPAGVDAAPRGGPAFARPTRALVALGMIALCALLGEGAMADWSAVYLQRNLGTNPGLAAGGFAAFSLTMAVGRLGGDWLIQRLGPVLLVRLGGGLVALGVGVAVIVAQPLAAIIGFGCVGAGLATLFPLVLSTAARNSTMASGPAIAAMSTAGYTGFLIGPPVIGLAAEVLTLRWALGLVIILGILIAALAPAVKPKDITA